MRLFVAADLPDAVRAELAEHGRTLAAAGGWRTLAEPGLHITLAFLGEREADVAPAIAAAVEQATRPVGELWLGETILLPPRAPRVAAVAVTDPEGRLAALQAALAGALTALGAYRPEHRPFRPHVTVARRIAGPRGELSPTPWAGGRFSPEHVTLYESRPSPRGARYEALARVPSESPP